MTNTSNETYAFRKLGDLQLEVFTLFKDIVGFTDLCSPEATIYFEAVDGFLNSSFIKLFRLAIKGFELEATVSNGVVRLLRNGFAVTSPRYTGKELTKVMFVWAPDHIGCVVRPSGSRFPSESTWRVSTAVTFPPPNLPRMLRANHLLHNDAYRTVDDFYTTIVDCIRMCESDIRRHGAERFIWKTRGKTTEPMDEPEISRFVASYLSPLGITRNFDVVCEPSVGSGKLDFYVCAQVDGVGLTRVAIEAKKADSSMLVHGLTQQLPQYMTRIGTPLGIYLVYWLKSDRYPFPKHDSFMDLDFSVLNIDSTPPHIRVVPVDLSFGHPPSKAKRQNK